MTTQQELNQDMQTVKSDQDQLGSDAQEALQAKNAAGVTNDPDKKEDLEDKASDLEKETIPNDHAQLSNDEAQVDADINQIEHDKQHQVPAKPKPQKPKSVQLDEHGFATSSGPLEVYNYDETGAYTKSEKVHMVVGVGLPANSTNIEPPQAPAGKVAVFDAEKKTWSLQPSHVLQNEAKTTLKKVQGEAAMAFVMGQTFGPQMRDYVQKLNAIASGQQTVTALPAQPGAITQ